MRSERPFASFARRLTRGYVVVAVALIVVVVAATSALALLLYAGALNEVLGAFAQRAAQRAASYQAAHRPLTAYAPLLANKTGGRVRVSVYDDRHHLLAASAAGEGGRFTRGVAALLGVRPAVAHIDGGVVVAAPDFGGLGRLLGRYLAFVLPIGALAVLVAWSFGRRIAGRAIAPLQEVTRALRRIAAGDFTPEPLLAQTADLRDLTTAYNDVAHRLTTASAQRERDELRMRQFIADAGHELRTPLTIVMGYLEVLQQGVVHDPDGVARVHETMLSESRRMRTVIDKLILLARLERPAAPNVERIDVGELAQRAARSLEPLAGAGRIAVTVVRPASADADESEIYEAIENVVANAVRYAPESPVTIDVSTDDGSVRVVVSDRGPGMDEQDLEHAFDRFYRGSARGIAEGSGLGLAIAKRALERTGGSIAVDSRLGQGTRVVMTLPAGA